MSYTDRDTLYSLYVEDGLDQSEIAERFDTSQGTISRWIRKHEIKRPLSDPDFLEREYHENGKSLREIADEIDSYPGSVQKAMTRHGIDTRKSTQEKPPSLKVDDYGHQIFKVRVDGTSHSVRHARLLAVAKYGFDAVKGMDVHHKNEIPWDDREDNIELLTRSEHSRQHFEQDEETGRIK